MKNTNNETKTYSAEEKKSVVYKVSIITIIINVLLAVAKVVAGILGNSKAMTSDAIHSVSDVLSTLIVIISAAMFKSNADEKTIKKNKRVEFIFSIVMAVILLITSVDLIIDGVKALVAQENGTSFSFIEIGVSLISIAAKVFIFLYTVSTAKKIDYTPLTANAWHQAADALTSAATIIGVASVKIFNTSAVDSVMAILIALFILHIAFDVTLSAIEKLKGKKCSHGHKHNCDKCIPNLKIDKHELAKHDHSDDCDD